MSVRVFIADDNGVLRGGLCALVNMQPDMEVVGEAANGSDAVIGVQNTEPDVALMDLTMPNGGGLAAIAALKQIGSKTPIVVLTVHDEIGYVRAAERAGAAGYVVKSAVDTKLLAAIRAVAQGRTSIESSIPSTTPADSDVRRGTGELTGPELEVLRRLAEGFTNGQIADELHVDLKSVETSRSGLIQKLGLASRSALVRFAFDCGVLTPGAHAA
jgi:two-component system response regulator NreC